MSGRLADLLGMPALPERPQIAQGRPYIPPAFIEPGNVDLFAQPEVRNPDGTASTVDSIGINLGGVEYLLPTVTPDGRHFANIAIERGVPKSQIGRFVGNMAVKEFLRTGRHLGAFQTPKDSTDYAIQLHEEYAGGKYRRNR